MSTYPFGVRGVVDLSQRLRPALQRFGVEVRGHAVGGLLVILGACGHCGNGDRDRGGTQSDPGAVRGYRVAKHRVVARRAVAAVGNRAIDRKSTKNLRRLSQVGPQIAIFFCCL